MTTSQTEPASSPAVCGSFTGQASFMSVSQGFIKTEARVTFLPVTAKADPSQKAVKGVSMPLADSEKQRTDISKEKSPLFSSSMIMSCFTLLPSMVSPPVPTKDHWFFRPWMPHFLGELPFKKFILRSGCSVPRAP